MAISGLAAGDLAMAVLGGAMGGFQMLRAARGAKATRRTNAWAAALAFSGALYCALMGLQYGATTEAQVRWLVGGQFSCLVAIATCLTDFAEAATGQVWPMPRPLRLPLILAALALVASAMTATTGTTTVAVTFLDHPFLKPKGGPLTDLFVASMLITTAVTVVWLARHTTERLERIAFTGAIGAWVTAAAADALTTVGLAAQAPMFFLEYGVFFLSVSLVVVDVNHYTRLLVQSEELRARLDRDLDALIHRLPLPSLVHRGGKVVTANPAASSLLGYGKGELDGTEVGALVHPDDREIATARQLAIIETGNAVELREERLRRKDGSYVTIEVGALPALFHGQPAIIAMGVDVTARRALAANMMTMDRMIAVGTLAAGVAHEINNPLAYVAANLQFANESLPAVEAALRVPPPAPMAGEPSPGELLAETVTALREAAHGAERVRRIVRDLTSLSRAHEPEQTLIHVNEVVESAATIVNNELKHRGRLTKDWGNPPPVLANGSRLSQVFINLLINAAQAIPEGRSEENQVRIRTLANAQGQAVVEISDTGSGIAPEHRARIFDPFFTTKQVGQGTGLGLAICQGIVRECGGTISFEDAKGGGTTFRVVLPPAPVNTKPTPVPAPETTSAPRSRVLVIDDEPLVGAGIGRLLQKHEVVVLSSAREALERLLHGESFDVILCDLMMPDFTGAEFFAALEQRMPRLAERVVFITGGAFSPEAAALLEKVPNPRLEKPFDAEALARAMLEALKGPRP